MNIIVVINDKKNVQIQRNKTVRLVKERKATTYKGGSRTLSEDFYTNSRSHAAVSAQ